LSGFSRPSREVKVVADTWELASQAIEEPMDALVAYLIWDKMGLGFKQLAFLVSRRPSWSMPLSEFCVPSS